MKQMSLNSMLRTEMIDLVLVWFFSRVLAHMDFQHGLPRGLVVAYVTYVRLELAMDRLDVLLEALGVGEVLAAQITLLLGQQIELQEREVGVMKYRFVEQLYTIAASLLP